MAIFDRSAAVGWGNMHLRSGDFDALLARSGTAADIRVATPCACWDRTTRESDPACMLCFPFGMVYDAPKRLQVFGPNRKPTRRSDAPGTFDVGDAFFTLPTGEVPTHGSLIVLPLSIITVSDHLTKGTEDIIRYPHVVAVESAHYTRRNPPAGSPYVNERVDLTFEGSGADITITDRKVTWNTSGVADGTRYVLRFTALATYMVWEQQDRNEGGKQLPWRFLCKRVDHILHPRGDEVASY